MANAAAFCASDFGWHHPGRKNPAFSGLNFEISPGEKVLLLGHSGAGKSTLLHAMAGLLVDEDGESQLGSLTVNGANPAETRGLCGLMQQDPESSVVLARVGDDVAFGPENLGVAREEIWQRVGWALDAVGLGHLELDRSTSALSGGQKQRLGLAGILAMHPGALLLDEPTANLDPAGVTEVRDAVLSAQAATGATLVVIEHRVGIWAEHMDRVIVLGREGITHNGPVDRVLAAAREELVDAGVWVPNYAPRVPVRAEKVGEPLIVAQNLSLTRAYPSRKQIKARAQNPTGYELDLPVIASGLDLQVRAGEHLAIVGRNGAGKSTLALTLAGLLYPVAGSLEATDTLRAPTEVLGQRRLPKNRSLELGADIASWQPAALAARIGLVFQEPEQQFICSTVQDELEFGPRHIAKNSGQAVDEEALGEQTQMIMERLKLTQLAEANPFTLSGGEKRRLSVATALTTTPRLLVLDEPTFGQDAKTWHQLVLLLHEVLDRGTAVLSVTHDKDFIAALGGTTFTVGGQA